MLPISPVTWWLTGLPGAGKTTLAQALQQRLRPGPISACVLDGDVLRRHLSSDLGYGEADRHENMRRTACLARLLNEQSLHAIVALISPTRTGRAMARNIVGQPFLEVHVATALEVCAARDPKGLYAAARQNPDLHLTGVSAPYEVPESPELILDTATCAIDDLLDTLLKQTLDRQ